MDLMLRDGDLLPGADGQPLTVTGWQNCASG